MKVAVLGATGTTGSLVVKSLLERNHQVVAMSRSKPELGNLGDRVESRVGNMTDPAFVSSAIKDCDAVISCLGHNHKSANLWSARTSPADILASVARAVVSAIGQDKSKHFVYLSEFGVGEDLKKHSIIFRLVLRTSPIGDAYRDHAVAEEIIKSSAVDWTIVRPVGLTNSDKDVDLVDRGNKWSSFENVSRKSLARFLVECAEYRTIVHRSMTIGEKKS